MSCKLDPGSSNLYSFPGHSTSIYLGKHCLKVPTCILINKNLTFILFYQQIYLMMNLLKSFSIFFSSQIPSSNEGKEWFWYMDKSVTTELLEGV
jgi:hypothetical protein